MSVWVIILELGNSCLKICYDKLQWVLSIHLLHRLVHQGRRSNRERKQAQTLLSLQLPLTHSGRSLAAPRPTGRQKLSSGSKADLRVSSYLTVPGKPPMGGSQGGISQTPNHNNRLFSILITYKEACHPGMKMHLIHLYPQSKESLASQLS